MDLALYPSFNASGYLLCPAGGLGLLTCQPQYTLCHQPPPSFTDPDQPDSWLLVQCDQPATHHSSVVNP